MFELDNNIALVTGASRGIGYSVALALAQQGASVIGTSTTKEGAEHITNDFRDKNLDCHGEVLDVTKTESVEHLIRKIESDQGHISILVNNAGVTRDNILIRMKNEEWNEVIDTNLSSIFRVTKACLKNMIRKKNGRIINLTSVVGKVGNIGQTNYAASKAGMVGFTKSLALEVASRGITVNAVAPGFIETEMTAELEEKWRAQLVSKIPIGRLGATTDISSTIIFLASNEASYITGQVIHANGGMYMSS
ncbi:MAG: 3-oxoacyl-ACP reductase [Acidiferrobacteraceae bacterium]|nr:3-oxoacyl-ACP reductase [Acidiferrobacteraceae bacterium]|tara:strand:- start:2109 stop:2858 length:750 start_codon:yes stop_codon:yes gene_type:complete